jgi:hypothetical protein
MAIGDGLCDPETMTDYGDFLFSIGLIDEDDRDYFAKVTTLLTFLSSSVLMMEMIWRVPWP